MGLRLNTKAKTLIGFRRRSTLLLAAILVGCLVAPWLGQAQFAQPAGSPPTYQSSDQVPTIIQGNSVDQTKLGSLLIGEKNGQLPKCPDTSLLSTDPQYLRGCSRLCLNADPTKGATDTANCITSWSDLSSLVTTAGPYLRKLPADSATIDSGYIGVQGAISGWTNFQLISLATEAYGGSGPSGNGAIRTEGYAGTNYAAQFAGTLFVDGPTNTAGTKLYPGQLCLNDQAGGANTCITTWGDIVAMGGTNIIRLQDLSLTTAAPDNGNAASGGALETGALILGQPSATVPVTNSCGDGMCSSLNGETKVLCPSDCS